MNVVSSQSLLSDARGWLSIGVGVRKAHDFTCIEIYRYIDNVRS